MRVTTCYLVYGAALMLVAIPAFLALGCGGGNPVAPPSGVTVADAGGTWFGPMGTTTSMGMPLMPAATGSITIDGGGNVTAFSLDGVPQPANGRVTGVVSETHRVFSTILNGVPGILMQSSDGRHALYLDQMFQFAAFQKDAAALAASYTNADVFGTAWSGSGTRVSSLMATQGLASLLGAAVDGAGMFTYNLGAAMNSGGPLGIVPGTMNGQVQGPFSIAPPPGPGVVLGLLTPDKAFMATLAGWGPTLEDLEIAAWLKN